MYIRREETDQSINRKNIEDLYHKYMTLAMESQKKGNRVLSESYYQQAEYYLHLMNNPEERLQAFRPVFKKSASGKKIICNPNLKKASGEEPLYEQPDTHMKESASLKRGGTVVPFRGSFLRRNRHGLRPPLQTPKPEHEDFKE